MEAPVWSEMRVCVPAGCAALLLPRAEHTTPWGPWMCVQEGRGRSVALGMRLTGISRVCVGKCNNLTRPRAADLTTDDCASGASLDRLLAGSPNVENSFCYGQFQHRCSVHTVGCSYLWPASLVVIYSSCTVLELVRETW